MTGTTMNNSLQEAIKPKMRNTNQREIFPCEMRDFCERERLRDGKYLVAGERERERGDTGQGRGRGRCGCCTGERDREERAMMRAARIKKEISREIFPCVIRSRAN
jgi:hypothetical protein